MIERILNPLNLDLPNLDLPNLVIAILAFLVALYSIHYTKKLNRRKLQVTDGVVYLDEEDPPIAWVTIHNISPHPVTLVNVEFFDGQNLVSPIPDYEPVQAHSALVLTPEYKYADQVTSPRVLQPYTSDSVGYYFSEYHSTMTVRVTCLERIHHFGRRQSFVVHFVKVD